MSRKICKEQDCRRPLRQPDHNLCYDHFHTQRKGETDQCPNHPEIYKPARYPVCRECHTAGKPAAGETIAGAAPRGAAPHKGEAYVQCWK